MKNLYLCPSEDRKSYTSGMIWGRVKDERSFIFGWSMWPQCYHWMWAVWNHRDDRIERDGEMRKWKTNLWENLFRLKMWGHNLQHTPDNFQRYIYIFVKFASLMSLTFKSLPLLFPNTSESTTSFSEVNMYFLLFSNSDLCSKKRGKKYISDQNKV